MVRDIQQDGRDVQKHFRHRVRLNTKKDIHCQQAKKILLHLPTLTDLFSRVNLT